MLLPGLMGTRGVHSDRSRGYQPSMETDFAGLVIEVRDCFGVDSQAFTKEAPKAIPLEAFHLPELSVLPSFESTSGYLQVTQVPLPALLHGH